MIIPQCIYCKHFGKDVNSDKMACSAFQYGIPRDILLNNYNHRKPFPGDNGILFEEKETEKKSSIVWGGLSQGEGGENEKPVKKKSGGKVEKMSIEDRYHFMIGYLEAYNEDPCGDGGGQQGFHQGNTCAAGGSLHESIGLLNKKYSNIAKDDDHMAKIVKWMVKESDNPERIKERKESIEKHPFLKKEFEEEDDAIDAIKKELGNDYNSEESHQKILSTIKKLNEPPSSEFEDRDPKGNPGSAKKWDESDPVRKSQFTAEEKERSYQWLMSIWGKRDENGVQQESPEISVINYWSTNEGYPEIRSGYFPDRNGDITPSEKAKEFVRVAETAPRTNKVTWRGINVADKSDSYQERKEKIEEFINKIKVGDECKWHAPSSASLDPSIAGSEMFGGDTPGDITRKEYPGIAFEISSNNGRNISMASEAKSEKEVLFLPGSRFRVTGIKRNAKYKNADESGRFSAVIQIEDITENPVNKRKKRVHSDRPGFNQ